MKFKQHPKWHMKQTGKDHILIDRFCSRLRPYTDNLERGQHFTKICMYNVILNYFHFGKVMKNTTCIVDAF